MTLGGVRRTRMNRNRSNRLAIHIDCKAASRTFQPNLLKEEFMPGTPRKRLKKQDSWPVAYRWMAMGTLAVYTACGCRIVTATPFSDPQGAASQSPAPQLRRFDIPAGSLSAAMDAFHSATGLQITFATDGLRTLPSPGAAGMFTVDQALARVLEGTGTSYRYASPTALVIELKSASTTVEVRESVSPDILPSTPVRSARFRRRSR